MVPKQDIPKENRTIQASVMEVFNHIEEIVPVPSFSNGETNLSFMVVK